MALVQVSMEALVVLVEHEHWLRRNFVPEVAAATGVPGELGMQVK